MVLRAIPSDTTVTGIPGRAVKQKGGRMPSCDLDQVHLPDPVLQEFLRLNDAITKLQLRCGEVEKAVSDQKNVDSGSTL